MIICHSKKFVFVKTNKTAGSSFEALLCHYLSDNDLITAINLPEERQYIDSVLNGKNVRLLNGAKSTLDEAIKKQFSQHVSLEVAHSAFPESKNYFSFGLIRNPFNRYLSSYRWRNSQKIESLIKESQNIKDAEKKLQQKFLNFIRHDRGLLCRNGRNLLQGTKLDGTTWSVDCVYKLEELNYLEKELKSKKIIDNLDVTRMPRFKSDTFRIPKEINIWNQQSIDAVRVVSSWEIEQLGYPDIPETKTSKA